MKYYFDESGDWHGNEKKILVLGGVIFKTSQAKQKIENLLGLFKAEHKLRTLHAAEMNQSAKNECYSIIDDILNSDANAIFHLYKPSILRSKTTKTYDELYSELAANLVSILILGDKNPKIYYDMKFHYAYPENIFEETKKNKDKHLYHMMSAFDLTDVALEKEKGRILKQISQLKKYRQERMQDFFEEINKDAKKAISAYLWSELWLRVSSNEIARERFRADIRRSLKESIIYSGDSSESIPEFSLSFQYKEQGNIGIEVVDLLCNLVYNYGKSLSDNVPSVIKSIYRKIQIEEY
jgi:hypothetical protein